MNLIFSGALKGAGDTKFTMWTIGALSLGVMVVPVYVAVDIAGAGLYTAWIIMTFYICSLGLVFVLRYRQGKWKKMRVIEIQPAVGEPRGRISAVVDSELSAESR